MPWALADANQQVVWRLEPDHMEWQPQGTGVSRDGTLYTHATGFNDFNSDSKSSWYQFWNRGETTLNENINSFMDELCKNDDDSDAMNCEE